MDEAALITWHYQDLSEEVKDKVAHIERPNTLQGLIYRTVIIEIRLHKRKGAKKSLEMSSSGGKKKGKELARGRQDSYYGLQPMELDATQRPPRPEKIAKIKTSYHCGKPGHLARNCWQAENTDQGTHRIVDRLL